ncbi:DTW domain-containing protein [Zavarzinia compransoris]|uniref:tRNA-uridine aminocarboxypropyltransferase n=1 Tax=Zavarzinia marina TaxID=2911065 RepID=UPI001F2302E0|nr:tRNA-uridine aminocarboxypropyltransferase [Zavarzinia marina]MCF4165076.1 DTW domain-containing protein [Zavarzinia marina]
MTDDMNEIPQAAPEEEACPRCGKVPKLCVCEGITPIANKVELLILQHPQEQDKALGTAKLALLHLEKAHFRIGLSWASLSKALGREATPSKWAVLYLGSTEVKTLPKDREIVAVDAKGVPLADQFDPLKGVQGVILLDGTWSQAKTLWWRNPWVLKCRRFVLNPGKPSAYGKLRKEPRRESLSTLEAAAMLLSRLEKNPAIEDAMRASFDKLLTAYKAEQPKKDWRRRPGRR